MRCEMSYIRAGWSIQLFVLITLSGCGTYVPDIAEPWDGPNGTKELEFNIKKAVFCEIRDGVRDVHIQESVNGKPVEYLPGSWGAQVTLSLEVDESSAANPGVSFIDPERNDILKFPVGGPVTAAQSFTLGAGATISSQASRTDKFTMFYLVSDLRKPIDPDNDICHPKSVPSNGPAKGSSFLLSSDLGIPKWLNDALEVDRRLPSSVMPKAPVLSPIGGPSAARSSAPSAGGKRNTKA
jgi:hypothetical protein